MNTTAAAETAGVTAATIRTWCRRGVVTATKRAGRWIIDTASLAHRIAIGERRTAKQGDNMATTARVEWHRETEGHFIHVRPESTVSGTGDHLARFLIHFHDDGPVVCDCRSINIQSGYSHDFDPELCETVLRDAGWAVNGTWNRRRSMMTASVTAI